MGIPERIAKITAGKGSDFGAKPSRLQEARSDRIRGAIDEAKTTKRKLIRKREKEMKRRHSPSPLAACKNTRGATHGSAREEILAAMRGLDQTSTAYVMMQYAQDRSSYPQLLGDLTLKAIDLHNARNWKTRQEDKGKDIIRSMCRLALFELGDPKCVKCRGAKCGRNGGYCRRCKGSGKIQISDKDRSIALGVKYHAFRDTHGRRYGAVLRMIKALGKDAIEQIRGNLYGNTQNSEDMDE
jgi:hypothetical protein